MVSCSCSAKYIIEYFTATIVPIAVPFFCRNQRSPNLKTCFFMTRVRRWSISFIGYSGGKRCKLIWIKVDIVDKPWFVSMFVYIPMASAGSNFTLVGKDSNFSGHLTIWKYLSNNYLQGGSERRGSSHNIWRQFRESFHIWRRLDKCISYCFLFLVKL